MICPVCAASSIAAYTALYIFIDINIRMRPLPPHSDSYLDLALRAAGFRIRPRVFGRIRDLIKLVSGFSCIQDICNLLQINKLVKK